MCYRKFLRGLQYHMSKRTRLATSPVSKMVRYGISIRALAMDIIVFDMCSLSSPVCPPWYSPNWGAVANGSRVFSSVLRRYAASMVLALGLSKSKQIDSFVRALVYTSAVILSTRRDARFFSARLGSRQHGISRQASSRLPFWGG